VKSASATLLALFLCLLGCGKKSEQPPAEAANPIDPNSGESNSGAGSYTAANRSKRLFWESQVVKYRAERGGDGYLSSPAIGADGTVYVGSAIKKIFALDSTTGAKKWEFEAGGELVNTPAIGPDGTVYIFSYDWKLYALDGQTGIKKWEFETEGWIHLPAYSPGIGADGTVYVGSGAGGFQNNKLHALDGKTGSERWNFITGKHVTSSPAIGKEGTLYFGCSDKKVYALNGKTGIKKWEFETGDEATSSPAIGSDGTIYIGSKDSKIYALDGATGTKKWEFEIGSTVLADISIILAPSPIIGPDGTVYFGNYRKVCALNGKTGTMKWEFISGEMIRNPVIGDDGTIYVGSFNDELWDPMTGTGGGKIYALDGKTGVKKWEEPTESWGAVSPAIGQNGILYMSGTNGKVFAIKTESKGPAKSPWPMFGQNAQRTGRVPKK